MIRTIFLIAALSIPVVAQANPATPLPTGARVDTAAHSTQAVTESPRPKARRVVVLPDARWGNRGARRNWTRAAVQALRSHADVLPSIVPRDIATWCPAYPSAGPAQREAFWVGLISSLAKHESTFRPTAVGGGGRWFGLVQIAPATARGYGCRARSGEALKDPEANLSCALRIMSRTVARDRVVSKSMRGVAADWGPFHSSRKREDMRRWVSNQSYCAGLSRSLRPVLRPVSLVDAPAPDTGLRDLVPGIGDASGQAAQAQAKIVAPQDRLSPEPVALSDPDS
ncbi:transglycosylase SLT domain-containing protein [Cognatishimia sp. F0-27]|uniref:transglycosylase SLT domain-containing protein n=1 Tax=Cognatishimia sp. F0-27 TaxID=2816855 RepID=UPI001D0C7010|nr:transglycosylase SLT domain-containing protein [Cognatishimia sp. F0-27]MCC1491585.1 transglycosylase SLT domain-containing protein [Cognatishimia sp. F0-27]